MGRVDASSVLLGVSEDTFVRFTCTDSRQPIIVCCTSFTISVRSKKDRLFSKYGEGVQMDRLGWVEVTPENFASLIADRVCQIGGGHSYQIIEICSGLGGNTIQFALRGLRVVGVEVDSGRIHKAKHNCGIYGVEGVEWVEGDFLERQVFDKVTREVNNSKLIIFISPPWGGPDSNKKPFSFFPPASSLTFDLCMQAVKLPNVQWLLLYLPKGVCLKEISSLSGILKANKVIVEVLSVEAHPKACVIYFKLETHSEGLSHDRTPIDVTNDAYSVEILSVNELSPKMLRKGFFGNLCRMTTQGLLTRFIDPATLNFHPLFMQ